MTDISSDTRDYHLMMDRGDFETFEFFYLDADKSPIDLAGMTVELIIRYSDLVNPDSGVLVQAGATVTISGVNITADSNGRILINVPSTATSLLPIAGVHGAQQLVAYSLRITNPYSVGSPTTILGGPIRVYRNMFNV